MTSRSKQIATLKQLLGELEQPADVANDDQPVIDEQAVRERARRAAERMRRARRQ